ncbi:MAG: hypothetical protein ABFD77_11425 [Thermotogota bacterium]
MKRNVLGWALVFALAAPFAALADTYSAYHDSTAQTSTALVVSNAGDEAGTFTCIVYDADGAVIVETSQSLAAHASQVLFVDQLLVERDATTWGLLRIDAPFEAAVALWISASDEWVVVENVEACETEGRAVQAADYASTPNRTTGIGLVNPYDRAVAGTLVLYDAQGGIAGSTPFELGPRVARYVSTASDVGLEEGFWGLVVIEADAPLLLVLEYYDAERSLVDVDVVY